MKEKLKRIASNTIVILSLIVLFSLAFTKLTTGHANVFGYRVFYIMSESMEPTIMTNQFTIAKAISPEDVKVGDIIAYDRGDIVVIHRVIGINESKEGRAFYFQGDNNDFVDDPVYEEQILYEIVVY